MKSFASGLAAGIAASALSLTVVFILKKRGALARKDSIPIYDHPVNRCEEDNDYQLSNFTVPNGNDEYQNINTGTHMDTTSGQEAPSEYECIQAKQENNINSNLVMQLMNNPILSKRKLNADLQEENILSGESESKAGSSTCLESQTYFNLSEYETICAASREKES